MSDKTTAPRKQWDRLRIRRFRLRGKRYPPRRDQFLSWFDMRGCIVVEARGTAYAAALARRNRRLGL